MAPCESICSLSPDELASRLAQIRREIAPHVRASRPLSDGAAWRFPDTEEMRTRLSRLVELERECCSSLSFEAAEQGGGLELVVRGVPTGSTFVQDLDAHLRPEAPPSWGRGLLSSGALGVTGAFFLFCVVPIAIAAVAGSAATAWLGGLDDPLVIGAGALVLGAAIWLLRRRGRASGPLAPSPAPAPRSGAETRA